MFNKLLLLLCLQLNRWTLTFARNNLYNIHRGRGWGAAHKHTHTATPSPALHRNNAFSRQTGHTHGTTNERKTNAFSLQLSSHKVTPTLPVGYKQLSLQKHLTFKCQDKHGVTSRNPRRFLPLSPAAYTNTEPLHQGPGPGSGNTDEVSLL